MTAWHKWLYLLPVRAISTVMSCLFLLLLRLRSFHHLPCVLYCMKDPASFFLKRDPNAFYDGRLPTSFLSLSKSRPTRLQHMSAISLPFQRWYVFVLLRACLVASPCACASPTSRLLSTPSASGSSVLRRDFGCGSGTRHQQHSGQQQNGAKDHPVEARGEL